MLSHSTAYRALRVGANHSSRKRGSRNNYTGSDGLPYRMLSHSKAHRALRVRAYHSSRRRGSRNNYTPTCSPPIGSRAPRRYACSAFAEYSTTSHPGDTPPGCPSGGDNGSDGCATAYSAIPRHPEYSEHEPTTARGGGTPQQLLRAAHQTDSTAPCRYARLSSTSLPLPTP